MLISVAMLMVCYGDTTISTLDRDKRKDNFCGLECWEPFKLCLSKGNETNKNATGMVNLICVMKDRICRANCSVRVRRRKIEKGVFAIKTFCEEKCIDFKASCLTYAKMKYNFKISEEEETSCNRIGDRCTRRCHKVQDKYKKDMQKIIMKYNAIIAKSPLRRQLKNYVKCQRKCLDGFLVCTNLVFAALRNHKNLSDCTVLCVNQRGYCSDACIYNQVVRHKYFVNSQKTVVPYRRKKAIWKIS